jgi:hypothetical protein
MGPLADFCLYLIEDDGIEQDLTLDESPESDRCDLNAVEFKV